MTDPEAPFGYFPGTRIPRKHAPPKYDARGQCRHCGTTELVWEPQANRWVLTDVGGNRHVCKARRVEE